MLMEDTACLSAMKHKARINYNTMVVPMKNV